MNDRQHQELHCILCNISEALGGNDVVPANATIVSSIVTGVATYPSGTYRQIQFMNQSSSITATVNGADLAPLGTVSYKFPRDSIVTPTISMNGNGADVRVDYETW